MQDDILQAEIVLFERNSFMEAIRISKIELYTGET